MKLDLLTVRHSLFSVSKICATYGWGQIDKEMKVNKLITAHFKVKDVYQCRNLLWKGIDNLKKRAGKMTCAGFSGARFCPVKVPSKLIFLVFTI